MVDECSIAITALGISVNEQPEKFVVAAMSKQSKWCEEKTWQEQV
jgi:hypothetical protein